MKLILASMVEKHILMVVLGWNPPDQVTSYSVLEEEEDNLWEAQHVVMGLMEGSHGGLMF